MAFKQGQEHSTYIDGISVKIAEKYKPPPRISLAVTHSQRLTLNRQMQDNLPRYEFTLETRVKDKLRELRDARQLLSEIKRARLENVKEMRKMVELQGSNDVEAQAENYKDYSFNTPVEMREEESCNATDVLIPQQVNASARMLLPTPLKVEQTQAVNDKSPFNIADFEADTSSPFDNMELKTINDIEALAQVLKTDDSSFSAISNYNPLNSHSHTSATSYLTQASAVSNPSQFNYYPYTYNASAFEPTNGGYGVASANYKPEYNHVNVKALETVENGARSVNDIIQSLQNDLDNMRIPASVGCNPTKALAENVMREEDFGGAEDPCEHLSQDWRNLSKRISSMGFPLARVARICKLLEGDQKKVVEHLLAMSDLLDLGFPEKEVSQALLRCNNDRDKALDILIS